MPRFSHFALPMAAAAVTFGVGEIKIQDDYAPRNEMLAECQSSIENDEIVYQDCAHAIIQIAALDGQYNEGVQATPDLSEGLSKEELKEIEEIAGIENPERGAFVLGFYKQKVLDELKLREESIAAWRITNVVIGLFFSLPIVSLDIAMSETRKSRGELQS